MAEPEKDTPEKKEEPFFEIKGTKVRIGGVDMDVRELDPYLEPEEAGEGGPNAALEGEEVEEKEEEAEEEEPEAEPEKPEKQEEQPVEEVPPKEPEQKVPDKLKFQLKFRGEESEVELTQEQIANRLQILRSYQENEKEFWENKKKVDVHARIIDSEPYKEWLRERQEQGEKVPVESEPSVDDQAIQYEIQKRRDPKVISHLREWAMDNLTPEQIQILDSNPKVFMTEYDRIAAEVKKASEPPPPPPPKVDPKVKEQILKAKEVSKERAAVEKPGVKKDVSPESVDKKRIKQLERIMREGRPGEADRAAEELAYIQYFKSYGIK